MKEFIANYLRNYRQSENADYAILISGRWGSGKTYFVKQFLSDEQKSGGANYVYVSLNGICNKSEIDYQIVQQLHPMLTKKSVKCVCKLASTVVRGAAGFFSSGVVDIKSDIFALSKLMRSRAFVLVLDDIERCLLPPAVLFGYVSELLAEQIKVILVGAENQFSELHSNGGISYREIKEKVVGKTFEIPPDIDAIYESLVAASGCSRAKDSLMRRKPQLIGDFKAVEGHYNYRAFKNCFREVDFWLGYMPAWALKNTAFVDDFTCVYVALSYEVQLGKLKWEDYGNTSSSVCGDEKETVFDGVLRRHGVSHDRWFDPTVYLVLPTDLLGRMLFSKSPSKAEISDALKELPYFRKVADLTTWEKLWGFYRLEDAEVRELYLLLRKELKSLMYRKPEEVLQIFTILADMSENRIVKMSLDSVYIEAERYLDRLVRKGVLEDAIKGENYFEPLIHGFGCFAYRGEFDNKIWHVKIRKMLLDRLREVSLRKEKEWVLSARSEVGDPKSNFYARVFGDVALKDIPVFTFLKPRMFFRCFVNMPNNEKRDVGERLGRRTRSLEICTREEERNFWLKVKHLGEEWVISHSNQSKPIAKAQVNALVRAIGNWYGL